MSCYHVSDVTKNFQDAKQYCISKNAGLAVINDDDEFNFIKIFANKFFKLLVPLAPAIYYGSWVNKNYNKIFCNKEP